MPNNNLDPNAGDDEDFDFAEDAPEIAPTPRFSWVMIGVALLVAALALGAAAYAAWTEAVFMEPLGVGIFVTLPMVASIAIWAWVRSVEQRFRDDPDLNIRIGSLGASIMASVAAAMLLVLFGYWAVVHYAIVR
ncbi:MAG TPA: hypothetical protein VGK19_25775 [Capsulimonadaceae bacterium]|jgi:hypothetical protein